MFWTNTTRMKSLPASSKAAVSLFLIIAGIGYLFGFFTIYLSYNEVDQEPGLSVSDIRISFYGARDKTAMEASIDGTMKKFFQSEADYATTKKWLADGAPKDIFDSTVKPIFDVSCSTCHSSEAKVAGAVTETYADIEPFLAQDTGKSIGRLVSLSHTHVLALLPVIFILVLIFSFTGFPEWLKLTVSIVSFGAIVLDVGSWWLAKLSSAAAPLVIVGGASLGLSFAVLVLLPLYDMWFAKPKA